MSSRRGGSRSASEALSGRGACSALTLSGGAGAPVRHRSVSFITACYTAFTRSGDFLLDWAEVVDLGGKALYCDAHYTHAWDKGRPAPSPVRPEKRCAMPSALRPLRLAGAALLITGATATAVTATTEAPAEAVVIVNPADYQQVDARPRRRRARRADVAGRAARPLGPAHRPQRHGPASPTRPATPRSPASSPSTPTTRRACRASAVDPSFATNRFIYLYYSPPLTTPAGDAPGHRHRGDFAAWKGHLNLSRFTLNAD